MASSASCDAMCDDFSKENEITQEEMEQSPLQPSEISEFPVSSFGNSSRDDAPANEAKGKNSEKNLRKKQNRKISKISGEINPPSSGSSIRDLRVQVRMVNGRFNAFLKDALLRDLRMALFSLPPNSFMPTFKGHGLRFGMVWFAPENEQSCAWLKETLLAIKEIAGEHNFFIEPFNLNQVKIILRVPWDNKENLTEKDVLKRLSMQNSIVEAHNWTILRVIETTDEYHSILCSIDSGSMGLLKAQNFLLNYGFQKILVKRYIKKAGKKNEPVSKASTSKQFS